MHWWPGSLVRGGPDLWEWNTKAFFDRIGQSIGQLQLKVVWKQKHPTESWSSTIEELWCGLVLGGHRLRIIDEEGDVILEYLNRVNASEERLATIRGALLIRELREHK